jgi:hypothetical protein
MEHDRTHETATNPPRPNGEEVLVVDSRARLTPAQMVERKLIGLLRGGPLPVSQMLNAPRGRGPH